VEITPEECKGSGIKTNYIRVQKLSEFEKFYNNPDYMYLDFFLITLIIVFIFIDQRLSNLEILIM
jgi:hypothetical protein